ncbi:hypothetical protein Bca52824_042489 [Brassica carinata]|uniref:C2H2-type domain-containing protein n=1 Tax=Brassica carinata TaxID=52824 RepID=A0A8X7RWU4_BRACI|nr:hypothetical protein Bca52824_042489 [Brassica carinata]
MVMEDNSYRFGKTVKVRITCNRREMKRLEACESDGSVAGAPGVAEELFEARQSALAMEKGKSDERPMLYTCRVCGKGYRSSKAHEQHCKSWRHVLRVSQGTASNGDEDVAIVTPLPRLFKNKDNEENSDEELADADEEEASDSLSKLNVNESGAGGEDDADMHKHHGQERLHVSLLQRHVPCIQQLRSCKKAYGSKYSLQIALQ